MNENSAAKSLFSNIIQIGVIVKDMDKTIERLTALGIGPFYPKILPPGSQESYRGKPFNGRADIKAAMMGDVEFELIQPLEGESPASEFFNSKGEGFQHIACEVENLEQALEQLTEKGVEVILHARRPRGGIAYVDLGVSNILVELVQRK